MSARARAWLAAAALLFVACASGAASPVASPVHGLPNAPGPIDALARRFGRLRARVRDRGGRSESGPWRAFLADGEGVSVSLDLPVDRCTTFVALGGGTVRDLRLALYDGDGDELVRDDGHGEGGVVHVCPTAPVPGARVAPYHLVALAKQGEGAVLVSSFSSAQRDPPDFAGLYDGLLVPPSSEGAATDRLATARDALRARHLVPVAPEAVARLAEGDAMRTTLRLGTAHCYTAIARGGDGVRDVDLLLFDASGAEVARDLAEDAEPALSLCPEADGTYSLEARAFRGAGAVAVQVLAGPREDAADLEAPTDPTVATPASAASAMAAPLVARGFSAPLAVVPDGEIAPGEVRSHEVPVPAGCLVVLGVSPGDATDLDLYVEGADGRELGRDTGVDASAHVGVCLAAPGSLRIVMKAYGREGRYALVVLRAPDALSDLAALRLDEAAAPFRARGYSPRETRAVQLSEGVPFRETLAVPSGRCVALAAAGSADVTDVDVTLRDASGALIARDTTPAPDAAVSRCAAHDETLSVEVVAYRGAGNVLVVALEGAP